MAQQLQLLLQERQQFVALQERNRLARDLHDSVKQQVFALGMRLSAARSYLDYDLAAATQQLVEADRLVAQTQQELTSIIHELRPAALQDRGLARALQEYIVEWSQQNAITASVQIAEAVVIPAMLEVALLRVGQEALSNVARHSRATAVQVQLVCQSDAVVLSILDNGQGFAPAAINGRSVGLHSMHERVAELGGHVDVYSTIGKGTCVVARCMLRLNQSTRGEHSLR
jgi:NarL family two-component system sensor histidine kinase LiaS